jgi:hypothetical protein
MTLYQSDQKAHRALWEKLQSLIVAPDRTSWKEFCEIDQENLAAGCAKYKQCPKHIKGIDERCWAIPVPPADEGLPIPGYSTLRSDRRLLPVLPPSDWLKDGQKTWCKDFALFGGSKEKNKHVVAYSYGVICKECTNKDKENGVALAGMYRQCSAPCPFTGCAVPELTKKEYDPGLGVPLGCPYNPRTANHDEETHLPNAFARVQCFISRGEFLRFQTDVLGLHMGFFAFIETKKGKENLYYLARDPYKSLSLSQMVYDARTGWLPDRYEHQKSYLFFASRRLALPVEEEDSLLKRLRGPIDRQNVFREPQNWRGFTQFDRDNQVLYVSDGEMSAFCLRWLLEEARNLWGQDGIKDDEDGKVSLNQVLKRLPKPKSRDRPQWYPRMAADQSEEPQPRGWAVEEFLRDRFLLGRSKDGLKGLQEQITNIRHDNTGVPPIVEFMGFDQIVTGLSLLEALGIVVRTFVDGEPTILGTERFGRLMR